MDDLEVKCGSIKDQSKGGERLTKVDDIRVGQIRMVDGLIDLTTNTHLCLGFMINLGGGHDRETNLGCLNLFFNDLGFF